MNTKEKLISQSLQQEEFKDWPEGAKEELKKVLGSMYDRYGMFGLIHHQNELLEGIQKIMKDHNMKEG